MSIGAGQKVLIRKLKPIFRISLILFWLSYALYLIITIPDAWFNPNYSRDMLLLLGILPSILLIVVGILYPLIDKVILTNEYVISKGFKTSKFYFREISKVDIGSNYIKLYKPKKKTITISWVYEDFEELKKSVLVEVKKFTNIKIIYRERYRD